MRRNRRFQAGVAAVFFLVLLCAGGALTAAADEEHTHADAELVREGPEDEESPEVRSGSLASPPERSSHRHRHREKAGFAKLIAWLGNFHPSLVHFPIAMLLGAAVAEALLLWTGRELFGQSARFCLWIGALSAPPTAVLGWFFGGCALADDNWVLTVHRWMGTLTAAWAVALLSLRERAGGTSYRPALFLGALLASVTGFFGGALVYGLDHYAW